MWTGIINAWQVLLFCWKKVRPIYKDLMRIIHEVSEAGLESEEARKKVFQDITDTIQLRGLEKVPDSVLNCSIELTYQFYLWKNKK